MGEGNMKTFLKTFAAASALALTAAAGTTTAQAEGELTLCWAAWDPANALVAVSYTHLTLPTIYSV